MRPSRADEDLSDSFVSDDKQRRLEFGRELAVLATLDAPAPDDATIRAEIDIDQRFIGGDYALPTSESTAAIRELARAEGAFVGPVYTGKGLAGLLHHARSGRIPADSNVAFLHTGDTGNLFEIPAVVGHITKCGAAGATRSASTAT